MAKPLRHVSKVSEVYNLLQLKKLRLKNYNVFSLKPSKIQEILETKNQPELAKFK